MHPFFFGSGPRRLFGIYEPALQSKGRRRAALLCHPWGPEYLHAHRSMRRLSQLLAAAGTDALRFDYYATGDSAGGDAEGDLDGWRRDTMTAAEELISLSGTNRLTLVGLRLGGAVAAQTATELGPAVERLVLWDPVVEGSAYLDELREVNRAHVATMGIWSSASSEIGGDESAIHGFPLTARFRDQLAALSLGSIAARIRCPVHIVASTTVAACERMRNALSAAESVKIERIETPSVWVEDWRNAGVLPTKTLRQIVDWATS